MSIGKDVRLNLDIFPEGSFDGEVPKVNAWPHIFNRYTAGEWARFIHFTFGSNEKCDDG